MIERESSVVAQASVKLAYDEECSHWVYFTSNGFASDCFDTELEAWQAAQSSFEYYAKSWSSSD